MTLANSVQAALVALYYVYPSIVLVYFLIASVVSACNIQTAKKAVENQKTFPGNITVVVLSALFLLTYVGQLATIGTQAVLSRVWPTEDHIIIGHLSCILVFGILLNQYIGTENGASYPFVGSWVLALLFEITIISLSAVDDAFVKFQSYEIIDVALVSIRCLVFLILVGLFSFSTTDKIETDEERQPLLPKDTTPCPGSSAGQSQQSQESGYGSTLQAEDESTEDAPEYNWERREREAKEVMKKRLEEGGTWIEYAKGFQILFPYVWPVGNIGLQLRTAAVCLCLFASNALHLLIPRQTGIIMDSLSGDNASSPWLAVLNFATLRLAASESGIELVRQWLWVPVKYYSHDALTRAAYSHMMHLSADFHDSKSSSDMMMAIYGGSAVSNVVENVLLYAVPMLIDMGVAVVYLSITFGPYEGLITVATGIFFLLIASRLVASSKAASRNRVNALYEEHYVRQSGLLGWQTVSAFNQIGYEDNRHANAVTNRWLREQQYVLGWYISIGFQTLILTSGLLASAFLAVYRIRTGHATSGQFAMLLMYWAQLTSPLQFFAKLGKTVSDDFIDAERLLDIMRTKPSVENQKGARPLKFVAGEVDFDNVSFSYDKQKGIIKNVSFHVPAGQTVAFVGATGAGKSTLIKLLDRFYDVAEGSIRIDGQDIRDVDLFSLRDRIGVVPQSPILFDDTIMNNVRYGRITASDDDVFEACKAACIHDKIKGFTHGYKTRVGERGVKLSGGELQRIAIARAMLKKPDIVLLDEATSSVDTDTEQQIQVSFKRLCQGRTTFIVAHRLSTIMNADRIIVVENGEILQQGNHNELIVSGGRYADLWSKQVFIRPTDDDKTEGVTVGQAGFVNDLSSEQTRTELSKVKPTPATKDEGESSQQQNGEEGATTTPSRNQEASRLNPVAPTFTPRSLGKIRLGPRTEASTSEEPVVKKANTVITNPKTSRRWSDEVNEEGAAPSPRKIETINSSQTGDKRDDTRSGVTNSNKVERHIAFATAEPPMTRDVKGHVSQPQPAELKHPCYSRRVQSKSEPSHDLNESAAEQVALPDVPEEPTILAHRHVSAPMKTGFNIRSQIPRLNELHQTSTHSRPLSPIASDCSSYTRPTVESSPQGGVVYARKHDPSLRNISAKSLPADMGSPSNDKKGSETKPKDKCKGVTPGNENERPSNSAEAEGQNPRRASRGSKRGRGSWYRGRRGRGNNRGGTAPPNSTQV
ncbi:Heavy metal tolerance protein [Neonectria ditissima]|uniref:Heavy metal tolerance protein n=1 Tax=Neonectria ditissima TaxID=78410 RepID=A0A0P7B5F2_9HYPO|nr:Heavy metal tolerance protein [Neonectria ditissima]